MIDNIFFIYQLVFKMVKHNSNMFKIDKQWDNKWKHQELGDKIMKEKLTMIVE